MNPNTQTQVTQTLTGMPPVVGVVMGSSSDWDVMQHAVHVLKQFGVPHEARVVSAHRMPDDMFTYAEEAAERGLQTNRIRRKNYRKNPNKWFSFSILRDRKSVV